ncbi:tRNA (N(6)-L-threonylcarbamoyladenosine(37)-C(2))-methylthiotransferase MtaB [Hymenobacter sp. 15J16-1T3B]|uniref:tRNA (N(6)-L-threonylcarbamoyladenosine(37)-C(2))- methylthiotransferase MtaB n=1 Tax=Hymenobacter sp. 15J16-1T3B TaxID=2886941 RepID=UPI001D112359|nr:tRNA (N(6)-L-threonylcarbamoyladenosine(37)-C(2))-methylthiotransferase MtaB [Hymenobacter sp. 15J16-1T3B]MCC3158919.1 tRNA (N(6)-L-threonylcarbamoyladenosine(37)-C(2))-methylthiotransferase MtaB [Hymenobacter sp. 15J16-1T3B]
MNTRTVAFYTLGCKLNFSETSALGRQFEERGFEKVAFEQGADVYVINTCSVTDHADRKCRKVVQQALKHNPEAYVTIVGCYAQLKPREIAEIPGVHAVLGAAEKFRLAEILAETAFHKPAAGQPGQVFASPISEATEFHAAHSFGDRTRTFLKVQDGCDYSCSFCTIPLARGGSRSGSVQSVVERVQKLADTGVKEIVLTGVNLGDFGLQGENRQRLETFTDLVKHLNNVAGIQRFRISSCEPNLLTDEIIRTVAASERFMPHFHIPLQSGSNKILGLMRRRYRRELYAERVALIKEVMPHACIGVDVIVGFPGETEADFRETYQFLNELPISYLHVFPYSERDNTLAPTLPGRVQDRVRHERTTQLRSLSEKKKRFFYEQHLGLETTVLFEDDLGPDGRMEGFTPNYIRVVANYDPLLVGEVKHVRLTEVNPNGLMEAEEMGFEVLAH